MFISNLIVQEEKSFRILKTFFNENHICTYEKPIIVPLQKNNNGYNQIVLTTKVVLSFCKDTLSRVRG
ncbi:hypothetical protein Lal_00026184 [Lupinus albus]|nr:hypothetical protein Lal_00026184 [Lupinus albus]